MARRWSDLSENRRRLIIAAAIGEAVLKTAVLIDIRRRPASQIRGSKRMWITAAVLVNSAGVGPLSYFAFGRRRPTGTPVPEPGPALPLSVVGEASAGAADGEHDQADREDHARSGPRAAVGWGADRPGPRGGPAFQQRVLAERHVAQGERPGQQAAGDQRAQQPDAGDADDVAGQDEDSLVEAFTEYAQLKQPDGHPGQPQGDPEPQIGQPAAGGPLGFAERAVRGHRDRRRRA